MIYGLRDLFERLKFWNFLTSKLISQTRIPLNLTSTDTGGNVQKWTRLFSTRRWVVLVARTRRKEEKKILTSALGQIRLYRLTILMNVCVSNKDFKPRLNFFSQGSFLWTSNLKPSSKYGYFQLNFYYTLSTKYFADQYKEQWKFDWNIISNRKKREIVRKTCQDKCRI